MVQVEQAFAIPNRLGLHGRAAARLVETARRFDADIWLIRENCMADCKSILDVMTMACTKGTPIAIRACGDDAEAALAALARLIDNRFDEE